jgi:Xaa-Pro aminopeptidase
VDYKNRIPRVCSRFKEHEIEAILVSQPENLFYLSGCEGLEGYLLITEKQKLLITDFRYIELAKKRSFDFDLVQIKGKMADWLPELIKDNNIRNLGFEGSHLTVSAFGQISDIIKKSEPEIRLLPVNGLIESLRAVKDADEIKRISKAVNITDLTFKYVEEILRPGLTEKDLSWKIERFMRENGSQPIPFELIVAAGPNSALPHAKSSDYEIKAGEPIVIDIGSKFESYGSDLTRTFIIGKPDEKFKNIYQTVQLAQVTAISQIKSGISGKEADSFARNIINLASYGEAFGHSLGHGIGLVTHESPNLGPNSTDTLMEGMVFTVEPGIYISGWGGIRIEDDVVIENGKAKSLSSAPKFIF